LWSEIGRWWRALRLVKPGQESDTTDDAGALLDPIGAWIWGQHALSTTRLQSKHHANWFAVGVASKEAVNMEGYHAPHILVVFDEAKGIRKPAWDAVRGMRTTEEAKLLVASTPGGKLGEFYKVFDHYRSTWKNTFVIHPRALQGHARLRPEVIGQDPTTGAPTPGRHARSGTYYSDRVSDRWVEQIREELGEDNPVFISRVMGEFPDLEGDVLIPHSWLNAAALRKQGVAGPRWVGVDVARYGRDRTVFLVGEGGTLLHCETVAKYPDETTAPELHTVGVGPDPRHPAHRSLVTTAHIASRLRLQWGCEGIAVDDTGVGGGVSDILTVNEGPGIVLRVNFGAAPTDRITDPETREIRQRRGQIPDTVYANLKAQMGRALQMAFETGSLALGNLPQPIIDLLIEQTGKVGIDFDNVGRIKLVDPDDMDDETFPGAADIEGKRSPDHFHALLIYWWAIRRYRVVPRAGAPAMIAPSHVPAHIRTIGEPVRTSGVGWTGARPGMAPAAGRTAGQSATIRRRY
ncbi:MAG: hypothetical protein ACREM3_28200, partial [Candidatus Rokuibacteriota bacterium]